MASLSNPPAGLWPALSHCSYISSTNDPSTFCPFFFFLANSDRHFRSLPFLISVLLSSIRSLLKQSWAFRQFLCTVGARSWSCVVGDSTILAAATPPADPPVHLLQIPTSIDHLNLVLRQSWLSQSALAQQLKRLLGENQIQTMLSKGCKQTHASGEHRNKIQTQQMWNLHTKAVTKIQLMIWMRICLKYRRIMANPRILRSWTFDWRNTGLGKWLSYSLELTELWSTDWHALISDTAEPKQSSHPLIQSGRMQKMHCVKCLQMTCISSWIDAWSWNTILTVTVWRAMKRPAHSMWIGSTFGSTTHGLSNMRWAKIWVRQFAWFVL